MISRLFLLPPAIVALIMTLFTWLVTAMGAAAVFFVSRMRCELLDLLTGFGAGVMTASSFWSLLQPALEFDGGDNLLMTCAGFSFGVLFILAADKLFDLEGFERRFGHQTASMRRSIMLILAVTIHNIPEGMAVGVAVAGASLGLSGTTAAGAAALAAGIAVQNFPEGASVSLPLRREGFSLPRSFWYGQLSGMPEPIAGVIGALLAMHLRASMPFLFSFAAGTMIAVVTGEMLPESAAENKKMTVIGVTVGFLLMMTLDTLF